MSRDREATQGSGIEAGVGNLSDGREVKLGREVQRGSGSEAEIGKWRGSFTLIFLISDFFISTKQEQNLKIILY